MTPLAALHLIQLPPTELLANSDLTPIVDHHGAPDGRVQAGDPGIWRSGKDGTGDPTMLATLRRDGTTSLFLSPPLMLARCSGLALCHPWAVSA